MGLAEGGMGMSWVERKERAPLGSNYLNREIFPQIGALSNPAYLAQH